MELLFIRHAQTIGNQTGNYDLTEKGQLSKLGYRQALCLAEVLLDKAIDRVICSPYERTMHTIIPYLDQAEAMAELWPELAEGCYSRQKRIRNHGETHYNE